MCAKRAATQHKTPFYDDALIERLGDLEPTIFDMETAVLAAHITLAASLDSPPKRSKHAVVLSGGVDSAILVGLLVELGIKPICITAGAAGAPDFGFARKVADAFGLELITCVLDPAVVTQQVQALTKTLGSGGLYTIANGIVLDTCLIEANKKKVTNMWAGNGLGIAWHEDSGNRRNQSLYPQTVSWPDTRAKIRHAYGHTDDVQLYGTLGTLHKVKMRLPFESESILRVARTIDSSIHTKDRIGKAVLRRLAMRLGVPAPVAYRPKATLQNSSNTFDIMREAMAAAAPIELRDHPATEWKPEADEFLDLRYFVQLMADRYADSAVLPPE